MVCLDMMPGFGANIARWRDRDGISAIPIAPTLGGGYSVTRTLVSGLYAWHHQATEVETAHWGQERQGWRSQP